MASFSCRLYCLLLPTSLLLLFYLQFFSVPPLLDLSQATKAFPLASSIFPINSMREGNKPMKAIIIKVRMDKKKALLSFFSVFAVVKFSFFQFSFWGLWSRRRRWIWRWLKQAWLKLERPSERQFCGKTSHQRRKKLTFPEAPFTEILMLFISWVFLYLQKMEKGTNIKNIK